MPEAPAPSKNVAWPRPLAVAFLAAYVAVDLVLWLMGGYYLMLGLEHIAEAGQYLTGAIVLLLLAGWMWRWWVARGWIGGKPTARFGGA